jgi:hypothetical protein
LKLGAIIIDQTISERLKNNRTPQTDGTKKRSTVVPASKRFVTGRTVDPYPLTAGH